ncbi:right-handed parallel beta-helix repeat-containing protein [Arthrobacter sp. KBS0702]|uniref:right-handed parallel beta-helix repeat-containing protein n=1 Tax=Arthrobacter sp. KBS0702 TaxID=2578107 RepID=UPI001643CBC6|nr:right-handed parallel beta-helix repeat-containing protein [Arthrobacter sp. KBS0702]
MKKHTALAALAAALLLTGSPAATAAVRATTPTPAPSPSGPSAGASDLDPVVTDGSNYKGNPDNEAALVASEDKRLIQVKTESSIARWTGTNLDVPYRVASGTGYTLVLTARVKDYTIDDLLSLAPKTFVRQIDGSYLLSENLVVESGATLTLGSGTVLNLEMLSTSQKFVSIINYGGRLNIAGTASAPVKVTSWDTDHGSARKITDNGRAYIRSIGGTVAIDHAAFADLGFWSGRTGGLSMTGSDRPITGAIRGAGAPAFKQAKSHKHPHPSSTPAVPTAPDPAAPVPGAVLPGGLMPDQAAGAGSTDFSYVTASVVDTTVTGNVYGLFLANAVGVSVHNVDVENSMMDGIVLHRNVSNATLVDSIVRHSALNGFRLSRAIRAVRLDTDKAEDNGRDGVYIDGRPLATGPSATGTPISSSGNDVVLINSTLADNPHYGLEVRGGRNTTIRSNTVSGSEMGIVVQDAAAGVTVDGNRLSSLGSQAIALRDGVTGARVTDNTVSGGIVGIYLRDAAADVVSNSVSGVTSHGISAQGAAAVNIKANKIAGYGPSAVDLKRAGNATVANNSTNDWTLTKSFWQLLVSFFQPLTIMWTVLALVLMFTALRGRRRQRTIRHPYAAQAPMSMFADLDPLLVRPDSLGPVARETDESRRSRRRAAPAHAHEPRYGTASGPASVEAAGT